MRRLALSRTACFTSQTATYWTSFRPRKAPRSPLPWLPIPMPAMTTRSLGAGRPSAPKTEAGMTEGKATSAVDAFRNERRVTADLVRFESRWVIWLFVHLLQSRLGFVAQGGIGGVVRHLLQGFPRGGRLAPRQRFRDLFVGR